MKLLNENNLKNKFWSCLNSFVFYSISPKKNIINWLIFFSIITATSLPYFFILLNALPAQIIIEILYWQAATFFLSNLLLSMNFSLAVMAIHFCAILLLPTYAGQLAYRDISFVLILLFIVYLLTYAFTHLKRWDMERIREAAKLIEIKQNRINNLFDNEFYAIVVHKNGMIQDINETFTTLFQYKLAEIKDIDLFKTLFREDLEERNKFISAKSDFNVETYAYRKSDEQIPIEIIGKKYEEDGEDLKICFIRDITSKKEMYLELTRHKNYLQKILDALPHAIFVKNVKTMSIQTANKIANMGILHGESENGFNEMKNASEEYQRGVELVKKTKLPLTIEESHVYDSGKEMYIEMYIHPFLDEKGEIEQLLEIITDITSRKKIEYRLKNTLKELRDIRDALDEHAIVSITDPDGMITYVNDRFIKVSGYTREELIGENHRILKSGAHSAAFYKNMWQTIAGGHIWQGEVKNRAKDGSFYWVSSTMVPFLDENHKPYQYVSIRTEITEQKRITDQLKEAKEEAERASRAKSTFLANMSHEIRTPLNAVLGMAELTMSTRLTPVQSKYLSLIQSSGENLLTIINEILDFSKIEADKLVVENHDFRLRQVLFSTLNIFLFQAKEKGLILSTTVNPVVPDFLVGDQQRIKQILINLIGNSLKFTETGFIIIDIDAPDYNDSDEHIKIKFTVADSGIGIPVSKQKLIFESFTQEDSSTTRKYGGTGLGTTISKELTKRMGGEIGVFSPVRHFRFEKGGVGSEFWFTIKCRVNQEKENEFKDNLKEKNIHAIVSVFDWKNYEIIQKYFKQFNIQWERFTLDDLENYKEMINPDVNLILIEMPKSMDRFAHVLMKLQEKQHISNISRIVVILEDELTFDTALLYEMGVGYFIYKPVDEISLLRMFNFIIQEQKEPVNFSESIIPIKKTSKEKTVLSREISKNLDDKKKMNVLVAEDNEINQFLLKTILESIGCSVTLASNGLEAVKILKTDIDSYDLVFMDLQMPEMNGFQATEEIRKSISKTIPIVAVTANAFKEDQDKTTLSGMNDFIAKPYTKDVLTGIIKKYTKRIEIS
jgi:PAS domain S-box-containing protein